MLCIRHRQDWESVHAIDVVPQSVNYTIFGYSTCQQMVTFNPKFCGCWYQKGDLVDDRNSQPTFTLPMEMPQFLAPRGDVTRSAPTQTYPNHVREWGRAGGCQGLLGVGPLVFPSRAGMYTHALFGDS